MSDLPLWFRIAILTTLIGCLVGVLIADARSPDFDAQATALGLVGVIGAALGLDQLRKGGKDE